MKEINAAIDIETTGLDPKVHDIIDIAVVPLDEQMRRLADIPEFCARLRASRPGNADPQALRINGLDPTSGEDEDSAVVALRMWAYDNGISRIRPMGHNVEFSTGFLLSKYPELNTLLDMTAAFDTMKLAKSINESAVATSGYPVFRSVSLSALRRFFGFPGVQSHRALDDARDIVEVYHALAGQFRTAI